MRHCPLCDCQEFIPAKKPSRLPDNWDFQVLECDQCGVVFSCAKEKVEIKSDER